MKAFNNPNLRFDQLTEQELNELSEHLKKPMTESYKISFWQKQYINSNLMTPGFNPKKDFREDKEFCNNNGLNIRK